MEKIVKEIQVLLVEIGTEYPKEVCTKCTHKRGCRLLNFINQIAQKAGVRKYDERFYCSEFKGLQWH